MSKLEKIAGNDNSIASTSGQKKKSTSVANNLLGCYECKSFKEAKENLIDVLDELEAFGMFNV